MFSQEPEIPLDPEFDYYYKHPGKYAETAHKIDLCMLIGSKPCRGGECDLDSPCERHFRIPEIVDRYIRMKERSKVGKAK